MSNKKVNCECGNLIDITGVAPSLDGTKVYCVICGTVTYHETH